MSRLGFKFAPIDVEILTHPKMVEACGPTTESPAGDIRPFGLWCWCVTYVTAKRTGGRVTRAVTRSAPGGLGNDEVASKLVASGLLIALDDGAYELFNHAKKLPKQPTDGKTSGARRTQRWRENRRPPEASQQASHVTGESVTGDVTRDVTVSTLSHLISSDLRSEEPPRTPREAPPLSPTDDGLVRSDLPLLDDARAKYQTYVAMRHLDTSVEDTWFGFVGHYAGQRFGSRDGILGKFQKWLTQQAKLDDKARGERRAREERDARRDETFASRRETPATPPTTPYKLRTKADEGREPSAAERAATRRLAAGVGLSFLDGPTGNDAPEPTGTE